MRILGPEDQHFDGEPNLDDCIYVNFTEEIN